VLSDEWREARDTPRAAGFRANTAAQLVQGRQFDPRRVVLTEAGFVQR
jgi:hypothetical protein